MQNQPGAGRTCTTFASRTPASEKPHLDAVFFHIGERTRWVSELERVLARTDTLVGRSFSEQPEGSQVRGRGRRASTLRSRVRVIRRFLVFGLLSTTTSVSPTKSRSTWTASERVFLSFATEAQIRTRREASFSWRRWPARTKPTDVRASLLQGSVHGAACPQMVLPGRRSTPAPRMYTSMLGALEQLVGDVEALPDLRVYAWQPFSDHRGLNPNDCQFTGNTSTQSWQDPRPWVRMRMSSHDPWSLILAASF